MTRRVAVIGGGWAGCAAALTLAEAGYPVSLFEAAATLGGRARVIAADGRFLDNGQHLLLGAYTQTLKLIAAVSQTTPEAGLMRLPLVLDCPGEFKLTCPRLPAPWHLLAGLLLARGLGWYEKWAALRWVRKTLHPSLLDAHQTVSQTIADQPERLRNLLWEPLCHAALNTAPHAASAQTFGQVLADAFSGARHHSDLLLPRQNLSALFPQPAARRITQLGGAVHLRTRVRKLESNTHGITLTLASGTATFDRIVIAVAPQHLPGLCGHVPELADAVAAVKSYDFEAIATAYLQYPPGTRLPRPMLALAGQPAQFVFDRGQTHGQHGLFAAVASAASGLTGQPQENWLDLIESQLAQFAPLPQALWRKSVIEKQATYACRPGLDRPGNRTLHPRIFLAGDYTAGRYPATLESATLSGVKSAQALLDRS